VPVKVLWSELVAVDLNEGKIRWRAALDEPAGSRRWALNLGPPLATAGGLVFVGGAPDGKLRAFDADSGKPLASLDLPAGLHAGPMTYRVDGTQYLVVAPGGHAALGSKLGGYVIAYALRRE
jgi:quinoprotein glucose dehydrogenase